MSEPEAFVALKSELQEIHDLGAVGAVLEWDQSTYMPEAGSIARARQLAMLGRLRHEKLTSQRMADLLEENRRLEESESPEGAMVRLARRDYERATRLPAEFVSELKNLCSETFVRWTQARPANDFASMRPSLERLVKLSQRKAEYLGGGEHVMDPLIDLHDPGMTVAKVSAIFDTLRSGLVPMVGRVLSLSPPDTSFLEGQLFPKSEQVRFGEKVAASIGYDWSRGRQDETAHPFMIRFSAGDIRITTRFQESDLSDGLFSTIHEAGHALYEQNISRAYDGTPLGTGVSAGVHESQSRLWENLVGRSRPFWTYFLPVLKEHFPAALGDVELDRFWRGINRVQRSLIRVEADEMTYNLHVMLRFDLERALLEGSLQVADLPAAWNERMEKDLGVTPPDDRDGVLQDVHWYCEAIGGLFQGYTLGNMMSAQFFAAASDALPDLSVKLSEGDFDPLRQWLTDSIYKHGSRYSPEEVVERATGVPLDPAHLLRYLASKYSAIYNIEL